jgi:hypothetical protein
MKSNRYTDEILKMWADEDWDTKTDVSTSRELYDPAKENTSNDTTFF